MPSFVCSTSASCAMLRKSQPQQISSEAQFPAASRKWASSFRQPASYSALVSKSTARDQERPRLHVCNTRNTTRIFAVAAAPQTNGQRARRNTTPTPFVPTPTSFEPKPFRPEQLQRERELPMVQPGYVQPAEIPSKKRIDSVPEMAMPPDEAASFVCALLRLQDKDVASIPDVWSLRMIGESIQSASLIRSVDYQEECWNGIDVAAFILGLSHRFGLFKPAGASGVFSVQEHEVQDKVMRFLREILGGLDYQGKPAEIGSMIGVIMAHNEKGADTAFRNEYLSTAFGGVLGQVHGRSVATYSGQDMGRLILSAHSTASARKNSHWTPSPHKEPYLYIPNIIKALNVHLSATECGHMVWFLHDSLDAQCIAAYVHALQPKNCTLPTQPQNGFLSHN